MAPFRNPFNRRPPPVETSHDALPIKAAGDRPSLGSRASSAISVPRSNKEPDEFKMSVVNDSGVYLPPSPPTEKPALWRRTPTSTTTSSHRSMLSEAEPFSISRESFDSYRRSFDISARSPVNHESNPRQSLDSRLARPRMSTGHKAEKKGPEVLDEETFEDVGLNEEAKPKKRGIFSRFGESGEHASEESARPSSSHRGFHLPGRKRGQSGQGAELGNMSPATAEGAA